MAGEFFEFQRRVEFCETDAAGIVHFSWFIRYMEQAEHALLRHLGSSVSQPLENGHLSWPRVSVRCDYQGTARFEELLSIEVRVARIGAKSITYRFSIKNNGQEIANGEMTSVCCHVHNGKLQSVPIAEDFKAKISPYLS